MKLSREQFEKAALEQLDMLYRVARRLTRDPDQASDLVQETYLRAIRAHDSFDMQEHGIRETWPAAERLLVCIGPNPAGARLVRAAKRMATGLKCDWIVVFVKGPRRSLFY